MDQTKLFEQAFNYIVEKQGKCSLSAAICCFESSDIAHTDKFAVGWAILSMLEDNSDEFDSIEPGLTKRMKESIVQKMC